jgi:hypothetical protein
MLQAYLDESGIRGGALVCIVAGYFGKKGPWRKFAAEWRATLGDKNFNVPLEEFHAKDLIKRRGFFQTWNDERHQDFLRALGGAVAGCRIHPVCYGLIVGDFFKFSLDERRFLTGGTWSATKQRFLSSGCPSKPYFLAFTECLKTVVSHTPMAERAHFFFGVDRPVAEYATRLFRYLKLRSKIISTNRFGMIGFPLASETPHLQVADLFSYLSYQHMLERNASGDWASPPSSLLLALLRNRKREIDTSYRTEKLIRDMISVVPNLAKPAPNP